MDLLSPDTGTIFWTIITFVLLLLILSKFAWKPIMKGLKEREDTIDEALNAANKTKEEMKELKFSNEQLLKEAKEERDNILRDARHVKENIIEEAKEKANEEANRIVDNAKEAIKHEKMAAITEMKNELASLSIEIAEKILKDELSATDKQKKLIDKLIKDVSDN